MSELSLKEIKALPYESPAIDKGYANETLYVNLSDLLISVRPVADQLMYLPGVTVVTSDPEIPPFVSSEGLVTVGKCVPEWKRGKVHVKGCPPNNAYVVQAIIGERAKAKRMDAEGDLESTEKKE